MKARLAQIQAAASKGAYAEATKLVSETPVEITGDELPPELRTATSGRFKKESFTFVALVGQLAAEFDEANRTFGTLYTALDKAVGNSQQIKGDLAEISSAKTAVVSAGVSFQPFSEEYDAITAGTDAVTKKVMSDPLGALSESETLKERAGNLRAALAKVLELKKSVVAVSSTIEAARAAVVAQRAKVVAFTYAGTGTSTFALAESGFNPDEALSEASAQLVTMTAPGPGSGCGRRDGQEGGRRCGAEGYRRYRHGARR